MNMNEIITGLTLTKVCNIKPFKGAAESKQITLAVKYEGLTLGDVFAKALRSDVISWQNGPGRKGYDGLVDKSTVNVSAKAPGAIADPETAMVAKLISMTLEEREAKIQELIKIHETLTAKDEPIDPTPTMTVKKVELDTKCQPVINE